MRFMDSTSLMILSWSRLAGNPFPATNEAEASAAGAPSQDLLLVLIGERGARMRSMWLMPSSWISPLSFYADYSRKNTGSTECKRSDGSKDAGLSARPSGKMRRLGEIDRIGNAIPRQNQYKWMAFGAIQVLPLTSPRAWQSGRRSPRP